MSRLAARAGTFLGGLPYLAIGAGGEPLVFLCGSTANHRNPAPGVERFATLRMVGPLAAGGFEVYFTNRWPGMEPDCTFAEVARRHAEAVAHHFGGPVDVVGHSTGGSLLLQLIADRPEVVRRAVVASAAYALGPVARRAQRAMLHSLETTGRYSTAAILEGMAGMVGSPALRRLLTPLAALGARLTRIESPTDAIAMLRAEDAFDVRDRLPQIPTETLVAHGGKDRFWPPEMFAETAHRIPRGRLAVYPRRGHALVDAPEFVSDVERFVRS